jgi:hypothetical protein
MTSTTPGVYYFNKFMKDGNDVVREQLMTGAATGTDMAFLLWIVRQHPEDSYSINGVQAYLAEKYGVKASVMRHRVCRLRKLNWIAITRAKDGGKRLVVNPNVFLFSAKGAVIAAHKREWRDASKGKEIGVDFD